MIIVEIKYINNIDIEETAVCKGNIKLLNNILNYFNSLEYVKTIIEYDIKEQNNENNK